MAIALMAVFHGNDACEGNLGPEELDGQRKDRPPTPVHHHEPTIDARSNAVSITAARLSPVPDHTHLYYSVAFFVLHIVVSVCAIDIDQEKTETSTPFSPNAVR